MSYELPRGGDIAPELVSSGGMVASHRHNNFDLLRLVFASLVILSHAAELLDGSRAREPLTRVFHTLSFGELGVDLFFILSGFLITASWDRDRRPASFLRKRVLRIYPGFIVAFLVSSCLVGAMGVPDAGAYWASLNPLLLLKGLVFLGMPATPPVFLPLPYHVVNGALWTIRYEFLCYLLVLGLGMARVLTRRGVPVLLWAGTLAVFVVFHLHRYGLWQTGTADSSFVATMVRFLPMFFAGAALYGSRAYTYRPAWLLGLAVVALVAGLCFAATAELAVASVGAYLVIVVGFIPARLPVLRRLPDISYGVYLYGWPMQKLVIATGLTQSVGLVFGASWALALLMGLASWHLVEKQGLRLKARKRSRPALAA